MSTATARFAVGAALMTPAVTGLAPDLQFPFPRTAVLVGADGR